MKLVKEHINEKFTQDSDPIHDLGVGIFVKRNFTDKQKFVEFLVNAIPAIINEPKIPKNILLQPAIIRHDIFLKVSKYLENYITFNGVSANIKYFASENGFWNSLLRNHLIKIGFDYKNRF